MPRTKLVRLRGMGAGHVDGPAAREACRVCDEVAPGDLLELDLLLADPTRWPRNVFAGLNIPTGPLPPTYRMWGGVKLGKAWLVERGYPTISESIVNVHCQRHVAPLPQSAFDTAVTAALEEAKDKPVTAVAITPVNFMAYYAKGLELGHKGLELMQARVQKMLDAGTDVPLHMLYKMADIGMRLATSEAALVARGAKMRRDAEEEDEGFRAGAMPPPGPRFGNSRVRVIEGEARPIVDRGLADRLHYNETARQEGSPELPAL